MKVSRTWLVWAALAVCAATVLGAMTWQTRNALASESERAAAEVRADLQERMRLALWRMDSLGATLVLADDDASELDFVKARFEWRESGEISKPDGSAISNDLRSILRRPGSSFSGYFSAVGSGADRWKAVPPAPVTAPEESGNLRQQKGGMQQELANDNELEKRSQAVENAFSKSRSSKDQAGAYLPSPKKPAAAAPADLDSAVMEKAEEAVFPAAEVSRTRPLWIGSDLFLMRQVSGPVRSISGSWIDQEKLRTRLLGEIKDLLPAGKLIAAKGPSADGLVLASFPFRLDPGPAPRYEGSLGAPIRFSLAAGWVASVLAILAASLLVFGIMRLSERRASFVSAVTHELRTPLTTFRLYSDMLESDAVKPEKRGDYLRVLSREADRLAHLVENVLAFSRIERGSARSVVSTVAAKDLLEPMRERFEARLATAGMSLEMPLDETAAERPVRADAAAIEHILFNLVDNAAKYASAGNPPVLAISVSESPGRLEIRVSDHGPGIPASEQRRIFRAFHKSAREAAETRPGVGLGLALSRRLAREMGGDLMCSGNSGGGSVFMLSLPLETDGVRLVTAD